MDWVFVFYGIAISIFGIYAAGIGVWGLIKKRALVFSARQLMWVLLLAYVPSLIQSFVRLFLPRGSIDWFDIFLPVVQVAVMTMLIFVFWRQMAGYMVFGVSNDTFRDGLVYALNQSNLSFQETLSKMRLVELEADLYAVVAEWMGTAQIRMKQRQHAHRMAGIANAMNEYYASTPAKVNNTAYVIYLLLGLLMIALVIGMGIFMSGVLFRSRF